jgi:endonuclease/exonuclease/phosphatase family metal-dependent hydrolase
MRMKPPGGAGWRRFAIAIGWRAGPCATEPPMNRIVLVAAFLLAGCQGALERRVEVCVGAAELPVIAAGDDGTEHLDLSVLIYNVEGLPWPARRNRGPALDRIGDELARLRAAGQAPDIILLQEVFTRRAQRIADRAGYRNVIPGPAAGDARRMASARLAPAFVANARRIKGERGPKLLGSGLMILSDFPVMSATAQPFSRRACAGYDCLANKGTMLARIWVPGMPTPLDVFTTHMNSQDAAGVDLERAHAAHRYQTDESAQFLDAARNGANPLIFGGDFNMRRAPGRLDHFTSRKPYRIVRHYCTVVVRDCDVRMSWDGDAPWLDTQDLQGFDDGATVRVRPLRAEALFDRPDNGGKLADHDGYMVTYRLSWPRRANAGEEEAVARVAAEGGSLCLPTLR